ncbi:MAG: glycosyltransferase family 4 protein [Streptococcaceae bacterium]|jgi:glycosyltransferase involved in cell wall biosynthesis|nr:glycosyltransferase family 4 protein [Streptococcaceae bacterium]
MSDSYKKTLTFFSGYSLPHVGGVEGYTDRLARELTKDGIQVICVSSAVDHSPGKERDELGIIHYYLPVYEKISNRYPVFKKNKLYRSLVNQLHNEKIDALICNARFYPTTLLGVKMGKKLNRQVFVVEHGSAPLTLSHPILDLPLHAVENCFTQKIKRYPVNFYVVSKAAQRHLEKDLKLSVSGIWHNNVTLAQNATRQLSNDTLKIAYVGRVIKPKGVELLLQAFNMLSEPLKQKTDLQIIGTGSDFGELSKIYQSANIHFIGRLKQHEIQARYQRIDIVVVPTIDYPEGLNSVVLEAGAAGCCVIATAVPGIEEIIESGKDGLLVEKGNVLELKEKLQEALKNQALRESLGINLQKKVSEKYSTESVAKVILKDIFGAKNEEK